MKLPTAILWEFYDKVREVYDLPNHYEYLYSQSDLTLIKCHNIAYSYRVSSPITYARASEIYKKLLENYNEPIHGA